ncbi:MAG: GIY-YIG nuclease family protein [Chromatiales bacterium]|nr:GIY-YIG nuclease family protein [Chromatiales bacterium]
MSEWQVYVLRCQGGGLYTGIATDVQRRLSEHLSGKGAKALRGKGPLSLLITVPVGNRSMAQRVEARIKRLPKSQKETLVAMPAMMQELIDAVVRDVAGSKDRPTDQGNQAE